ncbi:helix-turn-helix domain-containing protein [Micromonospora sp. DR5-3]|uniref:helix-turn-helix domain-containing protein n=1 Tax=unclassified Micromonospora TaxID=2617518 RepID=UPI00165227DF|nr:MULTISPECIES: helix-turn-helix domain-containing protein [unclassified Micromonospora]MCW3820162.1 helix-turn-helix domain-containing protein [Micromonospora sp. DR5-3]
MLSGQQAAVLAVLITARGTPLSREAIWAAMSRGYRPPAAAQIGVVIANIRKKIGAARILTGADGWWVRDPTAPEPVGTDVLSFGGLRLDVEHRYVLDGPARPIRLGPQEFAVLRTLVEAQGVPCSRSWIWSSLPPYERPATIAAVRMVVHRLRERLGRSRIITGGGGWRLAGPAKPRPHAAEWAGVRLVRTTSETWLAGRNAPVKLSPQQAEALQVLIDAQGEPRSGAQIRDGMSARARPKNAMAVGSVISRLRSKIGRDWVATGRAGWWLTDPTAAPHATQLLVPGGGWLDPDRRQGEVGERRGPIDGVNRACEAD